MESNDNQGVPLVKVIGEVGFIRDASGEFRKGYNELLKRYEGRARKILDIFSYEEDGTARGSNDFAPILARPVLHKGFDLASLAEFGQAFNTDPKFFEGAFQDPGLTLRTKGDFVKSNDYIAKNLARKVEKRGFKVGCVPLVISLKGLKLRKDNNSSYGLVYDLTDETEIIEASQLADDASIKRFSRFDERGMPIPDKDGKFRIYTRSEGLSGFYLGRLGVLYANDGVLADSYGSGRVVVVSGGATAQNLVDVAVLRIKEESQRIVEEVQERARKAKHYIRTGEL